MIVKSQYRRDNTYHRFSALNIIVTFNSYLDLIDNYYKIRNNKIIIKHCHCYYHV